MKPTAPPLPSPDVMYQALVDRDAAWDGLFIACVTSTGIFCRPTCPARKPRPENVKFVASAADAIKAGFRPCSRCCPDEATPARPPWAHAVLARLAADPGERLSDEGLRAMGIDPVKVRRYFRNQYGMTFQAWQREHRLGSALLSLDRGGDLLTTAAAHGYQSASGFAEAFARRFGTSPGRGGKDRRRLVVRMFPSPLGPIVAMASADGLSLLEFDDRRQLARQIESLQRRFDAVVVPGANPHLDLIATELAAYFAGTLKVFTTPLDLRGSDFQLRTWNALRAIPWGETVSYGQLAETLGQPGSARAVGRANGDNRLAIVVPCHRVIRSDGQLSGYGGGLWRKRWLLRHEQAFLAQQRA